MKKGGDRALFCGPHPTLTNLLLILKGSHIFSEDNIVLRNSKQYMILIKSYILILKEIHVDHAFNFLLLKLSYMHSTAHTKE